MNMAQRDSLRCLLLQAIRTSGEFYPRQAREAAVEAALFELERVDVEESFPPKV